VADGRITSYTRTIVTSKSTMTHIDENLNRKNLESAISGSNNVLTDLEQNYASASAPTSAPDGKIWYDSSNDYFKGRVSSSWAIIPHDGISVSDGVTINGVLIQDGRIEPAGIIKMYAGSSVPGGYLECNGAEVTRSVYSALYSEIGTNFGEGDGSTTFIIPDLRGIFPRGRDHGAGNDPDAASRTAQATGGATGDNVGSVQEDAMQRITGTMQARLRATGATPLFTPMSGALTASDGDSASYPSGLAGPASGSNLINFDSSASTSPNAAKTSDYETRPININLMFIIKY
jgi:microcystin-dependent protein